MGRKIFLIILAAMLPITVSMGMVGEVYNISTKKNELIFVPLEKEKEIGNSIARQVSKQFSECDDPLMQKRIEDIGAKIAAVCERKELIYRFKVLKSKEPDNYNAFSIPGGYVFIFDTFIEKLKTDDEIAAVLAHEVGHIAAKDSIKRLQQSIGMNALMLLSVAGARANGEEVQKAGYALTQLMMTYSREAEVQADALSVRYLKAAKYDPEAVVKVLKFMKDQRKKGALRQFAFFRTHPYTSERIAHAQAEVDDAMSFNSYINLPIHEEVF